MEDGGTLNISDVLVTNTGSSLESASCEVVPCNVDGQWTMWTFWSECSVSCGGGRRRITRECVGQSGTGSHCEGSELIESDCNSQNCPIGETSMTT